MALTDQDKERIKAEESYRNEVKKELNKVPWWKPKGAGAKIVVFIIIFSIFGSMMSAITGSSKTTNTSTKTVSDRELQGRVKYTNRQLVITNLESADWTLCKIKLNGKYNYPNKTSDWVSNHVLDKIPANDTSAIDIAEFTLNDGTRFSSYTTKPQDVSVSCENGFGYWKW